MLVTFLVFKENRFKLIKLLQNENKSLILVNLLVLNEDKFKFFLNYIFN